MKLKLNYKGFELYCVDCDAGLDSVQYIFRFENDYGASVLKGHGTYGYDDDKWELALLQFRSYNADDYLLAPFQGLLESSPNMLNDSVIGYLSDAEVRKYLKLIQDMNQGTQDA